jgi:hypothetical protein
MKYRISRRTKPRNALVVPAAAVLLGLLVAACGDSESESTPTPSAGAIVAATTSATSTPATSPAATSGSATPTTIGEVTNVWSGATVDPTKLPIGDEFVSTSAASVGGLWACNAGDPNAGGASADGPWIDAAAGTWDMTLKLAVEGSVVWEAAAYEETVDGSNRVLSTNSLPVNDPTGTFPIGVDDPAYQYDRNPGTITEQALTVTLPSLGTVAASPSCVPGGEIGMFRNGVVVFNSLDARGEDAVAREVQDLCNGHPAMTTYHYHNVPVCLRDKATGSSTVVGFAYDGFPIVVERDASGALPTNADLDECHGRTSTIFLDGEMVETYHYSATLEFPYFIGCFKGTPAVAR